MTCSNGVCNLRRERVLWSESQRSPGRAVSLAQQADDLPVATSPRKSTPCMNAFPEGEEGRRWGFSPEERGRSSTDCRLPLKFRLAFQRPHHVTFVQPVHIDKFVDCFSAGLKRFQ